MEHSSFWVGPLRKQLMIITGGGKLQLMIIPGELVQLIHIPGERVPTEPPIARPNMSKHLTYPSLPAFRKSSYSSRKLSGNHPTLTLSVTDQSYTSNPLSLSLAFSQHSPVAHYRSDQREQKMYYPPEEICTTSHNLIYNKVTPPRALFKRIEPRRRWIH